MHLTTRRASLSILLVGSLLMARTADADDAPKLTAEQQDKLSKIQAAFKPGGNPNSSGYGIDKAQEFCGAAIPMEIHPTTVAYDNPKKSWDRSEITGICHAVAGAVVYTCGYNTSDDPVVKEIVRSNVKRIVCKATNNASEVDQLNYQKYSLDKGTLTFTYLASASPGNVLENGRKFLRKNARTASGLSMGGHEVKRKMFELLGPKNTLVQGLKDECGIPTISVSVDDKVAEHYAQNTGHSPISACDAGLQSVYNLCRSDELKQYNADAVKASAKKGFKGIACVYSDTESIAIRPGGILELGGSRDAPRPKWEGRSLQSQGEYYMNWLAANHAQFTSGGVAGGPASSAPSSASGGTKKPTKLRPKK